MATEQSAQDTWLAEIHQGERFGFGKNWKAYLSLYTPERLASAKDSLRTFLGRDNLHGLSFIDIGSGSGLFSAAAYELGAQVTSFDYDQDSVNCTKAIREKLAAGDRWKVLRGSVLDPSFLQSLGQFDIVYSWGVLHHTGNMELAFRNVIPMVKPGGQLWIAIYNDQGRMSHFWTSVKKRYVAGGPVAKSLLLALGWMMLWGPSFIRDSLRLNPFRTWNSRKADRGMSPWYDLVDWVGGYPFEVGTPERVFNFFRPHGFELSELKTCAGGIGCNEFLFRRKT